MWVFEITNNKTSTTTEIDNPVGWDEAVIKLTRHPEYHGVFFDYTFDSLAFVNESADILQTAYEADGVEADCTLSITWDCDGEVLLYEGKFNFHKYKRTCAYEAGCWVDIPVENTGALMKFWNRIDQKVDLDSQIDFAGNAMDAYTHLGEFITLPAKGIKKTVKASLTTDNLINIVTTDTAFNDWANNTIITSVSGHSNVPFDILDFTESSYIYGEPTQSAVESANFGLGGPQIVQQFENQNPLISTFNIDCHIDGYVEYVLGASQISFSGGTNIVLRKVAGDPDINTGTVLASTVINSTSISGGTFKYTFSLSYTGSQTFALNEKLYLYIEYSLNRLSGADIIEVNVNFDGGSYLTLSGIEYAEPTTAKVYLINEALSRTTESITDSEMLVYSDYFGRTDSEPYTAASDGCGSLECITNGLLLRNAQIATSNDPLMSVSMKQLLQGLNGIHCIGIGVEEDTDRPYYYGVPYQRIRVENFEYFYDDAIIINCIAVNKLELSTNENGYISVVKLGYKKYEGEEYNGIDEFLSSREYRSTTSCHKKELDITSEFIASGYAIEITRQKYFDTKDWRFDNDVFIICLKRDSGLVVEQGNLNTTDNIIDPDTIYNYRLSPFRNALRWAKILLSQYMPGSADAKFVFTSGTGNYYAEGILEDGCILEQDSTANAENSEISESVFELSDNALPLWMPERVKFEYPLTATEYNLIKANPYGKIGYSFANEPLSYGWIDTINYKANEGMAEFNLIPTR